MSSFNSTSTYGENSFIKSQPEMLNSFYNTSDLFPYWVADMDFQIAEPITQELERLVNRGVYSYEFKEKHIFSAISDWYDRRHNVTLSKQSFVQVPGVLSGIALLLRLMTNKGDGVLIHTPAYHQFANLIEKAERQVVRSALVSNGKSYQIDFEALELQLLQRNVKVMIFCNPHNPTGRVWTRVELAKLVEISQRHNVLIISDEVHADIVYDGNEFTSLTSFDYHNVIALIGSPAKTFGMHSISNGYIYTNDKTMLSQIKSDVSAMYLDHGNALTTFATIAAFEKGDEWLDDMLIYLKETVNWVTQYLEAELPQIKLYKPEGTYQIWFDFTGLNLSEIQLNNLIFKEAKMGLTPGNWFGAEDYNFMRMNIATSRDNIIKSFELLNEAIKSGITQCIPEGETCQNRQQTSSCC
ncbi:MalY/PatB family protein [Shewanella sp. UCD-KL12]|uniref:MalY/PatB family protein n=1 Tax=Shewanella sp. UCD-KL12 TaxID=1917163 RepID=UPI000970D9EA|nr:PatB family C-S lyase [Shewanella sp. UCD-KL12]